MFTTWTGRRRMHGTWLCGGLDMDVYRLAQLGGVPVHPRGEVFAD